MVHKDDSGVMLARGFSSRDSIVWPVVRADTLYDLRYGKALVEADRRPGPVPVFGTNGQCGTHDVALFEGPGVVLGRKGQGPLGVEWVDGDFWVIDTAYALSLRRVDVDLKFSYYLIKYVGLNHLKDGTSNPSLGRGTFGAQLFPLPPLAEQRRIAGILGALDDKIELNRKMNETLEQMAQAIFKSWFIDFDGHTEFEDSELGRIPKGWRVVGLGETGKWVSGGTPSKDEPSYWNGDVPWFSAKSMGQLWLSDSDQRLTKLGVERGSRLVPRKTVLFIVRGMSLANEWRIGLTTREVALNQDLKGIVDDGRVVPELLLAWLLHMREEIRGKADEAGHGTKRLPTEILQSFSLVMPERPQQEELAKPIMSLLAKIEANLAESETLAALRDTLLPKLISGELRIPDTDSSASTPTQLPLPISP